MIYQKCPVCDGTGLVSRPPWVAGDQPTWADSSRGPYSCKVCCGIGVIVAPPDPPTLSGVSCFVNGVPLETWRQQQGGSAGQNAAAEEVVSKDQP